jgi:methionyl-tRNA formyltransferase
MTKKDLRIIFMGTPEFAVASLKALVENGYNVVGVITMPDKPAGRGYKLQPSAVKTYALEQGLTILQPEKLKDETFLKELKQLNADVQVVVAFRMLPETVWNMPPRGTFNLHSSLLPQYRGAAPINWAIINGEKETGVTTFFLTHEIDTGKIIFQEKTAISEDDNAGSLHDRLMLMGADLVQKTVDAIIDGTVQSVSQNKLYENEADLKPAPKIFKETCRIDWNKSTREISNFIRGLSPYPAAWTELPDGDNTHTFKLFSCKAIEKDTQKLPAGTIKTDHKTFLHIAVKNGFADVTDIQMSGKKRMKISDFLNGYKLGEGARFL